MAKVPELAGHDYRCVAVENETGALTELFKGKQAVINIVGPFMQLGRPVVEASLAAGCHYFDTTGETDWMSLIKRMYGKAFADRDLALLFDVRAQLHLARNRAEGALADALEAGRHAETLSGGSQPGLVAWRSTAAFAQLALDEPVRSRELAEEEHDLAAAEARLKQARADLRQQKANLLPSANAIGAYAHARFPGLNK